MIRAVISNGVIVPREPLPEEWQEGTQVSVQREVVPTADKSGTDTWMDEVETLARQGDSQDDERLDAAICEIRQREKKSVRATATIEG